MFRFLTINVTFNLRALGFQPILCHGGALLISLHSYYSMFCYLVKCFFCKVFGRIPSFSVGPLIAVQGLRSWLLYFRLIAYLTLHSYYSTSSAEIKCQKCQLLGKKLTLIFRKKVLTKLPVACYNEKASRLGRGRDASKSQEKKCGLPHYFFKN